MQPTEEVSEKSSTGRLYSGVSYFCASVQEQSNLKPYAQVCSRTAGSQSLYGSACRKYRVTAWALIVRLYSAGLVLVVNLSVILHALTSTKQIVRNSFSWCRRNTAERCYFC